MHRWPNYLRCLGATLLALPLCVHAQDSTTESETEPVAAQATTAEAPKMTQQLKMKRDVTFDRYINKPLLNKAIRTMNPELLADVALQFVQGERVLFRSHRSITASEVLQLAVQVATAKKDTETLDRLAQAIAERGDKQLSAQVKIAQQLSSGQRAINPDLMVSVDKMSVESFAKYQSILKYIELKTLQADQSALVALQESLPQLSYLGAQEKQTVERMISNALETIPAEGNPTMEKLGMMTMSSASSSSRQATQALAQVGGASRSTWRGTWMEHFENANAYMMLTADGYEYFELAADGTTLYEEAGGWRISNNILYLTPRNQPASTFRVAWNSGDITLRAIKVPKLEQAYDFVRAPD